MHQMVQGTRSAEAIDALCAAALGAKVLVVVAIRPP